MLNKEAAIAFVTAVNALRPYVPPMLFSPIESSIFASAITAVANGQIELEPKPVAPEGKPPVAPEAAE